MAALVCKPNGSVRSATASSAGHQECSRRRGPVLAGAAPLVSLNSSASFSVMAPPSSSASTMVTARR